MSEFGNNLRPTTSGGSVPPIEVYQELIALNEQAQAVGDPLLTESGLVYLSERIAEAGTEWTAASPADPDARPHWDPVRRRLSLRGQELHTYDKPALRQACILAAFEARGWPPVILNPMPRDPCDSPEETRQRLRETVKNLNAALRGKPIRFRVSQNLVYWEGCTQAG